MARETEQTVRAVWRTLTPALRQDVDEAVVRGSAVAHAELGTVALWRALRLRRQWLLALILTPMCALSAAVGLLLASGGGVDALAASRPSPMLVVLLAVTVGVPARRLTVVRRSIAANCDLALSCPQLTDRSSRAASELSRHLALRAAQARLQGGDSEA